MFGSRLRLVRSSLALAIVVALACSERVVTAPLERSLGAIAHDLACTTSWIAADGDWNVAANWDNGVPTEFTEACIPHGVVRLNRLAAARTLYVGAPATLQLEGVFPFQTRLEVTDGLENAGTLRMTSVGGAPQVFLRVFNAPLDNAGVLEVLPGTGGQRDLSARVINDGTMRVATLVTMTKVGGGITNNAAFLVEPTGTVAMSDGSSIQNGGTFDVNGAYKQSFGMFEHNGGTVSGNPIGVQNATLTLGAASLGGSFSLQGTTAFAGDIKAGQRIIIEALQPTALGIPIRAEITSAGFTNAGTLELTSSGFAVPGAPAARLELTGPLLNAAGGVIRVLPGIGGPRSISGFVNNGTVDIFAPTTINHVVNNGAYTISAGGSQDVAGFSFTQAGGTLTLAGTLTVRDLGTFYLNGGAIVGTPVITGAHLNIGGSATGRVSMRGGTTITGDVPSGLTILVEGLAGGTTFMSASAEWRNAGVIELTSSGGVGGANLNAFGLTNAAGGRIQTSPGAGGPRSISGNVRNEGTIALLAPTKFNTGVFENVAPGTINGGATLTITSATQFSGTGTIIANVVNEGHFYAGPTFSAGLLTITGSFTQAASGNFHTDIGGSVPGTDFDRVNVSGEANLGGTLNVVVPSGSCVDAGKSFAFLTYASVVNDFAATNAIGLSEGQTLTTSRGTTSYTATTVNGATCVPPDDSPPVIEATIRGTLGNNGWYVSDVTVEWTVTDEQSGVTSTEGCDDGHVLADNAGIEFTCSATSAGGTRSETVTIKRDATAPEVSVTRNPPAGPDGWNNTNVTVTYAASDALSGVVPPASVTQLFDQDGANQTGSHTFFDRAGNSAKGTINGINIDKTPFAASCSVTPNEIWPANNKMVPVTVTISGSGIASYRLLSVTNNETGTADTDGFAIGTADLSGSVRASRNGGGTGRTYTLTYEVRSTGGAVTQCAVTVRVPHDQGKR